MVWDSITEMRVGAPDIKLSMSLKHCNLVIFAMIIHTFVYVIKFEEAFNGARTR